MNMKRAKASTHEEQTHLETAHAGRLDQPLGDRRYGYAGDIYGGAGHLHRQRGAAAYFGKSFGRGRRIDLGADLVPGFQRDRSSALWMALWNPGPQTLLHVLRGPFHREFFPVRIGAEPRRTGLFSHFAGRWRRGIA